MSTLVKRHHRRGSCCRRVLIQALERAGFSFARSKATHAMYRHHLTGHTIAVPLGSRELKNGTLAKLLREIRGITGSQISI